MKNFRTVHQSARVDISKTGQRTWSRKCETKVTADNSQADQSTEILLRCAQEVELVQRRNTRNENTGKPTSSRGGGLHNVVFTRTKVTSEDWESCWQGTTQWFQDGEADDGAEQIGTESPASLETQVNVGRVDQSTTAATDEHGTDGDDASRLVREVVECGIRIVDDDFVLVHVRFFEDTDVGRADLLVFFIVFAADGSVERVPLLSQRRSVRVDVSLYPIRREGVSGRLMDKPSGRCFGRPPRSPLCRSCPLAEVRKEEW